MKTLHAEGNWVIVSEGFCRTQDQANFLIEDFRVCLLSHVRRENIRERQS